VQAVPKETPDRNLKLIGGSFTGALIPLPLIDDCPHATSASAILERLAAFNLQPSMLASQPGGAYRADGGTLLRELYATA